MKIINIRHVEDCFDGSLIKEIQLSEIISKALVYFLGEGGHVQYFANFAKPFFKVRKHGVYDLKGIAGNDKMRVHLKKPDVFTIDDLEKRIACFQSAVRSK